MVNVLREPDVCPAAEAAKKYGVNEVTISAWRTRFGALEAVNVKRLRSLEQENAKLKKRVAERDLKIEMMREVPAKRLARQCIVNRWPMSVRRLSVRRACTLMSVPERPCTANRA